MNIEDIKRLPISELANLAKDLNVAGASGMRRQDLIFSILQAQAEKNGVISGSGVLEILPDGFGSSVPWITIICPVPMTSTFRRHKSDASV